MISYQEYEVYSDNIINSKEELIELCSLADKELLMLYYDIFLADENWEFVKIIKSKLKECQG